MTTPTQRQAIARVTERAVTRWMLNELNGPDSTLYVYAGEVNTTTLGEEALRAYPEARLDDGPEADVWEWASTVANQWEAEQDALYRGLGDSNRGR